MKGGKSRHSRLKYHLRLPSAHSSGQCSSSSSTLSIPSGIASAGQVFARTSICSPSSSPERHSADRCSCRSHDRGAWNCAVRRAPEEQPSRDSTRAAGIEPGEAEGSTQRTDTSRRDGNLGEIDIHHCVFFSVALILFLTCYFPAQRFLHPPIRLPPISLA